MRRTVVSSPSSIPWKSQSSARPPLRLSRQNISRERIHPLRPFAAAESRAGRNCAQFDTVLPLKKIYAFDLNSKLASEHFRCGTFKRTQDRHRTSSRFLARDPKERCLRHLHTRQTDFLSTRRMSRPEHSLPPLALTTRTNRKSIQR